MSPAGLSPGTAWEGGGPRWAAAAAGSQAPPGTRRRLRAGVAPHRPGCGPLDAGAGAGAQRGRAIVALGTPPLCPAAPRRAAAFCKDHPRRGAIPGPLSPAAKEFRKSNLFPGFGGAPFVQRALFNCCNSRGQCGGLYGAKKGRRWAARAPAARPLLRLPSRCGNSPGKVFSQ